MVTCDVSSWLLSDAEALWSVQIISFYVPHDFFELIDLVRENDSDLKDLVPKIGPRRKLKTYVQKHYVEVDPKSAKENLPHPWFFYDSSTIPETNFEIPEDWKIDT